MSKKKANKQTKIDVIQFLQQQPESRKQQTAATNSISLVSSTVRVVWSIGTLACRGKLILYRREKRKKNNCPNRHKTSTPQKILTITFTGWDKFWFAHCNWPVWCEGGFFLSYTFRHIAMSTRSSESNSSRCVLSIVAIHQIQNPNQNPKNTTTVLWSSVWFLCVVVFLHNSVGFAWRLLANSFFFLFFGCVWKFLSFATRPQEIETTDKAQAWFRRSCACCYHRCR